MTPLYSAFMILPPARADTKKVPMMEETIEAAPSASGIDHRGQRRIGAVLANSRPPSSMVATSVTA